MKAKLTTHVLMLAMAVLAVLMLAGCSGPWTSMTPLDVGYMGWGETPNLGSTPANTTMMCLGSDEYGIGVVCSVTDPLSSLAPRTIDIVTLDGEPVDQQFQVKGQWLYTDPTRHQAWEESCGWCEGCEGDSAETTAINGVLTLAPHSVDPANPTKKPLKVFAVLRGIVH
jgi:hypothetical protein